MPAKEPHTSITRVVPELADLRAVAEAGDWPSVVERFVGMLERSQDLLPVAAEIITDANPEMVRAQFERDRRDLVAKALLAQERIHRGWEIRTGQRAEHVSLEQFDAFHQHLRQAERLLIELCAQEPEWSFPWSLRLVTALGLGLGLGESRRRYDRLAAHHPHHYNAQHTMLQTLCPKWHGTWDDAFSFARSCSSAAPAGSPTHALVAMVHLERWVEDSDAGVKELQRRDVRDELLAASAQSVFHPDFDAGFAWVSAHTTFAVVHALAGDAKHAAPHFRALGDVVHGRVWGYLGNADQAVNKIRNAALAKVRA